MSQVLLPPVDVIQASIDTFFESIILQSFLTGIYTLLFAQVIIPVIRQRKGYLALFMSALFASIIMNLATSWLILRSIVITHDATRETMYLETIALSGQDRLAQVNNAAAFMSLILADLLLVWRCYIVYQRNKWLLAVFMVPLIAESVLLPVYLSVHFTFGPYISLVVINPFISGCITSVATGLIIYRIINVSRQSINKSQNRYQIVIEILVESGALYTSVVVIFGILLLAGSEYTFQNNMGLSKASTYFGCIMTPITGIAPTLLTARVISGSARSKTDRPKSISTLRFERSRDSCCGEDSSNTV